MFKRFWWNRSQWMRIKISLCLLYQFSCNQCIFSTLKILFYCFFSCTISSFSVVFMNVSYTTTEQLFSSNMRTLISVNLRPVQGSNSGFPLGPHSKVYIPKFNQLTILYLMGKSSFRWFICYGVSCLVHSFTAY